MGDVEDAAGGGIGVRGFRYVCGAVHVMLQLVDQCRNMLWLDTNVRVMEILYLSIRFSGSGLTLSQLSTSVQRSFAAKGEKMSLPSSCKH